MLGEGFLEAQEHEAKDDALSLLRITSLYPGPNDGEADADRVGEDLVPEDLMKDLLE